VSKKNGVAIVVGSFHKVETEQMLAAAVAALAERGLDLKAVVRVPGAYEKPLAAKRLLLRDDIAGLVVLGIIERGETAHGRVMGQTVSDALIGLQLEFMKPIGIGIIGPEVHPSQIPARLHSHAVAAVAALEVMLVSDPGDSDSAL
jgi:6,7-dimethyl-8-ribityllumazine synthase